MAVVACVWLVGWLVGLALVCAFLCAFVSAFVCSFRCLFACVLSWVEIWVAKKGVYQVRFFIPSPLSISHTQKGPRDASEAVLAGGPLRVHEAATRVRDLEWPS